MKRKTKNFMTINCAFHPRADVNRLHVSRREGSRGMAYIEESECVKIKESSMSDYIKRTSACNCIEY